jgi:hypothetical protein
LRGSAEVRREGCGHHAEIYPAGLTPARICEH